MRRKSNHAAIHTTKGLTAFPISKYLLFWIVSHMDNQNSWCSFTSPQQWCIPPYLTPTLPAVFQAPQALLPEALQASFPSQNDQGTRSTREEAQPSNTRRFADVCRRKCVHTLCRLKRESLGTNKLNLILHSEFSLSPIS